MKRCLLILMMLLLPFQAIWAAGHCPHAGPAGHGHHHLQAAAGFAGHDQPSAPTPAVQDCNCGVCCSGLAIPMGFDLQPLLSGTAPFATLLAPVYISSLIERPERPNWPL